VMQAGIAACCTNTDDLTAGTRQHSPHDPCHSPPCCAPSLAVQTTAPQPLIRWERARLVDPSTGVTPTSSLNIRTLVGVCIAPANHRNAVPWFQNNFLARIQVFLI
jgi:hypothetical protein